MATIKKYALTVINTTTGKRESVIVEGTSKKTVTAPIYEELAAEIFDIPNGSVTPEECERLVKNAKKYRITCDIVGTVQAAGVDKKTAAGINHKLSKNARKKAARRAAAAARAAAAKKAA